MNLIHFYIKIFQEALVFFSTIPSLFIG